jgi:hypothetical protein
MCPHFVANPNYDSCDMYEVYTNLEQDWILQNSDSQAQDQCGEPKEMDVM